MTSEIINSAIFSHKAWVAKFRNIVEGIDSEKIDPFKLGDHATCEFGRWLKSPQALGTLGANSLANISNLHGQSLKLAGEMAQQLLRNNSKLANRDQLNELNVLSKQIVQLLLIYK